MSGYLGTLLLFYRRNVRVQPVRELMAIAGIAAGVALLFTVQVAHHTITGSFQQIASGVAGNANLEVASRNSRGFSETISEEIERTPGVRVTAPLLQEPIVAVGRSGRRALMLVGATGQILHLHGRLSQQFVLTGLSSLRKGFLLLTEATAKSIGVHPGTSVTLLNRGRERRVALAAIVPSAKLGAAGESPVAAAPLPVVQALAQAPGAVSRVLIQTAPGQQSAVSARLRARLGPTLNVRLTTTEARLLENAAGPEREITLLFSAISIVAGIILAYAALLLASDDRRRFVVYLIEIGTPESMIIASLAFDALVLGLIGTLVGLIAGDAISLVAFRSVPGYITAAFPVGGQRVVGTQIVLISIAGGMLAALTAAALPAIAILRSGAAAEPEAIGRSLAFAGQARVSSTASFVGGVILAVAAVLVCEISPGATVVAIVVLAVGLILCLPLIARGLVALGGSIARRCGDPSARLSVAELRRAPTRSVALLATGTVAVFLTVTISGSVADVQRAVRSGAAGLLASADLWVKPGGPENVYTTQPLAARGAEERLDRVRAVNSVLSWKDTFFDLPRRRVWVLGVPPQIGSQIVPSQLEAGSPQTADRRLREGGWIALSRTVASEYHVGVGGSITLPTPAGPKSFRVAALTANYGWLPGAIVMNREDLARDWQERTPTQLAVTLEPGVSLADGKAAVERALPAGTAVAVKTAQERRQEVSAVLGSTLSRLNDTTLVVLIGTIVSVIALITAAISQRRGRLDSLLSIGMGFGQFTRLIFYESGSMLLGGCLIGFGAGILGQNLIDKWLRHTTGAPVRFAPAWEIGLRTVLIAAGIALATSTVAVIKTTRPQLRPALQS
ncbi:MAG TPA: FtsX-like permease family protein [Solirubrobacteraceae bacterium]|nr:FtsX-like permease family protein [Solirubrobacteraceae bacterium]